MLCSIIYLLNFVSNVHFILVDILDDEMPKRSYQPNGMFVKSCQTTSYSWPLVKLTLANDVHT